MFGIAIEAARQVYTLDYIRHTQEFFADQYASLNTACADANTKGGGTVVIRNPGTYTIASSLSVASDVGISVQSAGVTIAVAASQTLTINEFLNLTDGGLVTLASGASIVIAAGATVELPDTRQVWDDSGGGTVTYTARGIPINPCHWGAIGDDSTDCTDAISSAFDCWIASGPDEHDVVMPPGTYQVTAGKTVGVSASTHGGVIRAKDATIKMTGSDNYGLTISQVGKSALWATGVIDGLRLESCGLRMVGGGTGATMFRWVLKDVYISEAPEHGIEIASAFEMVLKDSVITLPDANTVGIPVRLTRLFDGGNGAVGMDLQNVNTRYGRYSVLGGNETNSHTIEASPSTEATAIISGTAIAAASWTDSGGDLSAAAASHTFDLGQPVQVITTDTLPTGISATTDYYVVPTDANNVKFATSAANAIAGTYISYTNGGVGTHTIVSGQFYEGDRVQLATTDTLPGGLATSTDYYIIPVDAAHYKLATTWANAVAGTAIDIIDAGVGTHTMAQETSGVGDYDIHSGIFLLAKQHGIYLYNVTGYSIVSPHIESCWKNARGGPAIYSRGATFIQGVRTNNPTGGYMTYSIELYATGESTVTGGSYGDTPLTMTSYLNATGTSPIYAWGVPDYTDGMDAGVGLMAADANGLLSQDLDMRIQTGSSILPAPNPVKYLEEYVDFLRADEFDSGDWTTTNDQGAGGSTGILDDTLLGVLQIQPSAAANDCTNVFKSAGAPGEMYYLVDGKQFWFQVRMQISETDDADYFIGLTSIAPNAPVGAGLYYPQQNDHLGFCKRDAVTGWKVRSNIDGSTTDVSMTTAVSAATWHVLTLYFDGSSTITAYIDGVAQANTVTTNINNDEPMGLCFAAQNGDTAAARDLKIDYYRIVHER